MGKKKILNLTEEKTFHEALEAFKNSRKKKDTERQRQKIERLRNNDKENKHLIFN